MLFGHNSNVKIGENVYHVQTEDRGASHAVIDTMVYQSGRVLLRRANSYADLLPLDGEREEKLKHRVDAQHQGVLEELRSGALKLAQHANPAPAAKSAIDPQGSASAGDPVSLAIELLNAKTWLAGKRATLQVLVSRKGDGVAVSGAGVLARIDGGAEPAQHSSATGPDGKAQLAFDMPRLTGSECALVIEARNGKAQGSLRFQLRAKPKVSVEG
ncbi:MAG TPA: hypothetical protein VKQ28_13850 [Candidatus Acidoferrum sp.]|nr:hypothetical protein [Candidatus Acidoferrum sp.]